MDKDLWGSLKNRVNYSNGKFPALGEGSIANSLPLGQSKVVNPPPYPGDGGSLGFT